MSVVTTVSTTDAPAPAGPYSQGVAAGELVFLAGQTPRLPDGTRLLDRPVAEQVRQAMDNLQAVAQAAGGSLLNAVKINVFVRSDVDMAELNEVYLDYVAEPLPARTTTISELKIGAVEVDAILWIPRPPHTSLPAV